MQHRLAELFLAVDALDRVDLVDHVDQVLRFDHAPEHRVDADAPLVVAVDAQPQQFADVGVLAAAVFVVGAHEQLGAEAVVAVVPARRPARLERQRRVVVELIVELRVLGEGHRLDRDVTRKIGGHGGRRKHALEEEEGGDPAHQSVRLSVCERKSASLRPVRKR